MTIIPELAAPSKIINIFIPSMKCHFSVEQAINAPLEIVWSIIRQFHNPKAYKMFIRSSSSRSSLNTLGSFRNIIHSTGFPATTSIERLDVLNDELHVMVFSLVGGDRSHRLANYQGTISLLRAGRRTIVTETYKVDVPKDSNEEDTRYVVDTMVGLDLKSLARIAERIIV